jgi:iron(III) transport system substrate-binding protein
MTITKYLTASMVFLWFGFAATLQRGWAETAGTIEQLIGAAKGENTIEFYAPSTLTPKGAHELGAAFNKKYNLNIKLNYSPAGDMAMDVSKVVGQSASGVAPEWDLMVVTDAHHATLWLRKQHQPFNYARFNVNAKAIDYDNGTVSIVNQVVLPAYNNKLVTAKDAPKRWEDLLDPKWGGGKLGMPNTTHHLARLAAGPWGEKKTTEFVKSLAKQQPVLGTLGQLYARLQLGEILVSVTLHDGFINQAKRKGAPLAFAEGVEPVISPSLQVGVLKGARHSNAGHLFAVFLVTSEAQEIWEKYTGQSSAFVPGTTAYKYFQGKKVVYMAQQQAEMVDRLATEYGTILGFK